MSICICIQNENEILIAADTALNLTVGGELFRLKQPVQKLRKIGQFLVFGAGSADVMEDVFEKFRKAPVKNVEVLREIVVSACAEFRRKHKALYASLPENTRDVAVLAAEMVGRKSVVHIMGPQNDFMLQTTRVQPHRSTPHTGGYFSSQAAEFMDPMLRSRVPADRILVETIRHFSGAEVGGNITMALMNEHGIHFAEPIPTEETLTIRYHSGRIGGQLIGSQIMTDAAGAFPRAQMSNSDKMFKVEAGDNRSIAMRAFGFPTSVPSLHFENGSNLVSMTPNVDSNVGLYIDGPALHAELNRITLRGYTGVFFLNWSSVRSEGFAGGVVQTLQQALDAKASLSYAQSLDARISALGG